MTQYVLMHKNTACGTVLLDEKTGQIIGYKDSHTGASPFLGNCDFDNMLQWWKIRAVPASRKMLQNILRESGCLNTETYLAKNLALSMTDSYWLCPVDMDLKYENIRFPNLGAYNDGKIPYHNANATSYDPNASLGGQMEKYWDLAADVPVLVKESSKFFGQQSINEVVASYIHGLQDNGIPYVEYHAVKTEDNSVLSKCESFVTGNLEFVSAYEVLKSAKVSNDRALYDQYIDICIDYGIPKDIMQDFMDYQTMTDFIISNTDEHLLNFGILRDADSLQFITPAPIFDSGNSMFFNESRTVPFSRVELLERKITSFYANEEKMLAKVKNRDIVKVDLLPSPSRIKEMYQNAGIPEQKAEFVSKNYGTKIQMVREFQKGLTISLYKEKQREKQEKIQTPVNLRDNKLIMMCGIPGSGKTEQAESILAGMRGKGQKEIMASELYPIKQVVNECHPVLDNHKLEGKISINPSYKGCVTMVSSNDIRDELMEQGITPYHDLVFTAANLRIKTALANQMTVIYDATNVDADVRKQALGIADSYGTTEKILYVMNADPAHVSSHLGAEKIKSMYERLNQNYPSEAEGWTEIQEISPRDYTLETSLEPNNYDEENISL